MADRRQAAATAGTGYALVGAGGAIRGRAIDAAHDELGMPKGERLMPSSLAVYGVHRRRPGATPKAWGQKVRGAEIAGATKITRKFALGTGLATLGAPAAGLGTYELLHGRRQQVSKITSHLPWPESRVRNLGIPVRRDQISPERMRRMDRTRGRVTGGSSADWEAGFRAHFNHAKRGQNSLLPIEGRLPMPVYRGALPEQERTKARAIAYRKKPIRPFSQPRSMDEKRAAIRAQQITKSSAVAQGVEGVGEAWRQKGQSLKSGAPPKARVVPIALGAVGGGLAALAAHRGLDKVGRVVGREISGGRRSALTAMATVPGTLATIPVSRRVTRRYGYTVTPTGTHRADSDVSKTLNVLPWDGPRYAIHNTRGRVKVHQYHGDNRFTILHRGHEVLVDRGTLTFLKDRKVAKAATDYRGRHVSYGQQRAATTAVGATPFAGPLLAARQAGTYAPPGQKRRAQARQLASPVLALGAGSRVGLSAYRRADKSPTFARRVEAAYHGVERAHAKLPAKVQRVVRLRPYEQVGAKVSTKLGLKPAALAAGLIAGKATASAVGMPASQLAISRDIAAQRRYNRHRQYDTTSVNKADNMPMTPHQRGGLVRRKRQGALLNVAGGSLGLAGLALIGAKRPELLARREKIVAGAAGVGGVNAFNSASINRREASAEHKAITKAFDSESGTWSPPKRALVEVGGGDVEIRGKQFSDAYIRRGYTGLRNRNKRERSRRVLRLRVSDPEVMFQRVAKASPPIQTSMNDQEAHKLVHGKGGYGLQGPLPHGLDRPTKMRAYEARYVASGGRKSQRWQHIKQGADVARNVGIAGATLAGAADLAAHTHVARKLVAPGHLLARYGHVSSAAMREKATRAAVASATLAGGAELAEEGAQHRRARYSSAPGGVAASALRRMQGYSPPSQ